MYRGNIEFSVISCHKENLETFNKSSPFSFPLSHFWCRGAELFQATIVKAVKARIEEEKKSMDQLKRQYVFNAFIYIYAYFYAYVYTYLTDCCYLSSTFFDRNTGFWYLPSIFFYRNALPLLEFCSVYLLSVFLEKIVAWLLFLCYLWFPLWCLSAKYMFTFTENICIWFKWPGDPFSLYSP